MFFDTIWSDFDGRFKLILGNLKRHKELLDLQAVTSEMQEPNTTCKTHDQKLDDIASKIETDGTAHERKVDNIVDILGLEIQKAVAASKRAAAEYDKNEKARLECQRKDVVHWIDGIDCEDERASASFYRHPDTGLWLFTRQEFIDWCNGVPSGQGVPGVLWLTGMPGCGLLPTLRMNQSIAIANFTRESVYR